MGRVCLVIEADCITTCFSALMTSGIRFCFLLQTKKRDGDPLSNKFSFFEPAKCRENGLLANSFLNRGTNFVKAIASAMAMSGCSLSIWVPTRMKVGSRTE